MKKLVILGISIAVIVSVYLPTHNYFEFFGLDSTNVTSVFPEATAESLDPTKISSDVFIETTSSEADIEPIFSLTAVGDSIGYNIKNEDLSHLPNFINDTDIFIFNLEAALLRSEEIISKLNSMSHQFDTSLKM